MTSWLSSFFPSSLPPSLLFFLFFLSPFLCPSLFSVSLPPCVPHSLLPPSGPLSLPPPHFLYPLPLPSLNIKLELKSKILPVDRKGWQNIFIYQEVAVDIFKKVLFHWPYWLHQSSFAPISESLKQMQLLLKSPVFSHISSSFTPSNSLQPPFQLEV